MKRIILFVSLVVTVILSSCSRSLLVSSGARDSRPLLFQNEYNLSELKELDVDGRAIFGIPSFTKNNRNKHTSGLLFYFNGLEIVKTRRIYPIATLFALTAIAGRLAYNYSVQYAYLDFIQAAENNAGFIVRSTFLALPITSMVNNLIWRDSAFSGAARTLQYRLLKENPDIDLFYYPKYEITKSSVFSGSDITGGAPKIQLKYLWTQDAKIKLKCKGAKIKLN